MGCTTRENFLRGPHRVLWRSFYGFHLRHPSVFVSNAVTSASVCAHNLRLKLALNPDPCKGPAPRPPVPPTLRKKACIGRLRRPLYLVAPVMDNEPSPPTSSRR